MTEKKEETKPTLRLKELRELFGFTQMQVATFCGVSISAVQKWDVDMMTMRCSNLRKLHELFGLSYDELCGLRPLSKESLEKAAQRKTNQGNNSPMR